MWPFRTRNSLVEHRHSVEEEPDKPRFHSLENKNKNKTKTVVKSNTNFKFTSFCVVLPSSGVIIPKLFMSWFINLFVVKKQLYFTTKMLTDTTTRYVSRTCLDITGIHWADDDSLFIGRCIVLLLKFARVRVHGILGHFVRLVAEVRVRRVLCRASTL